MNNVMRKVVAAGSLFLLLSVALALPKEDDSSKDARSPAVDDDFPTFNDDQPAEFSIGNLVSGRVGEWFNSFLQLPVTVFRFVSGIIANQPFAKLREEVRNLNISYPK